MRLTGQPEVFIKQETYTKKRPRNTGLPSFSLWLDVNVIEKRRHSNREIVDVAGVGMALRPQAVNSSKNLNNLLYQLLLTRNFAG
jgi:hypothetical protein